MVASGLGVRVLPRDALTPKYHSRLVVPVPFTRPSPSRRIALAWRKSFPRPRPSMRSAPQVAVCRPKPSRQAPARPVRKGNP
jgi:LysR family hydrogen peroxide-inducible transcriptional activator